MKKLGLIGIFVAVLLSACGSQKQLSQKKGGNPFGDVYEAPCTVYDTKEDYSL